MAFSGPDRATDKRAHPHMIDMSGGKPSRRWCSAPRWPRLRATSCVQDAAALLSCDYVFSATDTQFARLAVNAVCHQYVIPGAKVVTDEDGAVQLAYAMHRPIDLSGACLECGAAIDPHALHHEQLDDVERRAQDYLDAPDQADVVDPSVTLNSAAVSMTMLGFRLAATAMFLPDMTTRQAPWVGGSTVAGSPPRPADPVVARPA